MKNFLTTVCKLGVAALITWYLFRFAAFVHVNRSGAAFVGWSTIIGYVFACVWCITLLSITKPSASREKYRKIAGAVGYFLPMIFFLFIFAYGFHNIVVNDVLAHWFSDTVKGAFRITLIMMVIPIGALMLITMVDKIQHIRAEYENMASPH